MISINGVAHIVLSVTDVARSTLFYETVLGYLEFKTVFKDERGAYFVGGRTAIGIVRAEENDDPFLQTRVGLHHVCLRARTAQDVDSFYAFLTRIGATVVRPAEPGNWAPGYYSTLFQDPDGIRMELCYVPEKGLLSDGAMFNSEGY